MTDYRLVEALEEIADLPMDPCSTENDYRLSAAKAIALAAVSDYRKAERYVGVQLLNEDRPRQIPARTTFAGPQRFTAAEQQAVSDVTALVDALEGLLGVIDESRGVSGYHLNGEIAEWDKFQEVYDAIAALDAYNKGDDQCTTKD